MAQDLIRYDVLAQEAFRGLVRKVLAEVAHAGLPGDHHFYIAFDTRAPGVRISSRLRERYPEEMTIVLQHQYRDLVVTDHAFEVGLSFTGIPERLLVPFTALKGFFDPSVEFAVTFPLVDENGRPADAPEGGPVAAIGAAPEAKPVAVPAPAPARAPAAVKPAESKPAAVKPADAKPADETADGEKGDKGDGKSAAVVSLDAFRKKP
jgi:hypothetical protein